MQINEVVRAGYLFCFAGVGVFTTGVRKIINSGITGGAYLRLLMQQKVFFRTSIATISPTDTVLSVDQKMQTLDYHSVHERSRCSRRVNVNTMASVSGQFFIKIQSSEHLW